MTFKIQTETRRENRVQKNVDNGRDSKFGDQKLMSPYIIAVVCD